MPATALKPGGLLVLDPPSVRDRPHMTMVLGPHFMGPIINFSSNSGNQLFLGMHTHTQKKRGSSL